MQIKILYVFKKLESALAKSNRLLSEAVLLTDTQWLDALKKSNVRVKGHFVKDLPQGEILSWIAHIRNIIPQQYKQYSPYYLYQILNGALKLSRLEDAYRLNDTIKGFIKLSRKAAWTGSKNLYDYKDWRELEKAVRDLGSVEYDDKSKDSIVLFTQKYENKNAALLASILGDTSTDQPYVQYWLRKITSAQGAYRYGRGTTWCTATDPAEYGNSDRHPYHNYNGNLYIIEKKTNDTPRRPLLQCSSDQIMNRSDTPIERVGRYLSKFIIDAVKHAGNYIDERSKKSLLGLAALAK